MRLGSKGNSIAAVCVEKFEYEYNGSREEIEEGPCGPKFCQDWLKVVLYRKVVDYADQITSMGKTSFLWLT